MLDRCRPRRPLVICGEILVVGRAPGCVWPPLPLVNEPLTLTPVSVFRSCKAGGVGASSRAGPVRSAAKPRRDRAETPASSVAVAGKRQTFEAALAKAGVGPLTMDLTT